MHRIRLICWNAAEAEERAALLQSLGYDVDLGPLDQAGLRQLRDEPPSAVVIALGRLPSQGRDVALTIRKYKATRHVPLVLVDGDPGKVARIKELLPDAVYTTWGEIGSALNAAMTDPPADPVVPRSGFDVYAGTPLPKKLGIKPNSAVALIGAPDGFEQTLSELPEGVVVAREPGDETDLVLWFPECLADLESGIARMAALSDRGGLWIAWTKKSSGVVSDLSQTVVRRVGLAAGLVDFKICAIDATWSALRFTRRKRG